MPLNINNTAAGNITLRAPASGTASFTFPNTNGSAFTLLQSDGTGATSWVAPGSSPGQVPFATDTVSGWQVVDKIQIQAPQATTSGTVVGYTGLASWVKRITLILSGVSTNGTSQLLVQIGTSAAVATTGYSSNYGFISSASAATGTTAVTTGFTLGGFVVNTDTISAVVVITNVSGNTWAFSGTGSRTGNVGTFYYSAAPITLSGALTQVQIVPTGGNTFDAGNLYALVE